MAEGDNNTAAGTNGAAAPAKAAAAKTEYETVKMADGREVQFAGKRKLDKSVIVDQDAKKVTVRFDLRNGQSLSLASDELNDLTQLLAMGHGISQKVGDEVAGVPKVEDMYLGMKDMIDRLKGGEWRAMAAAGDSFSGASIVIKAIAEVSGKSAEWITAFLTKKLETAKAKGEKLTRADLYASFRDPNSDTGKVIQRLEQEERSKETKVKASDLLGEISSAVDEPAAQPA